MLTLFGDRVSDVRAARNARRVDQFTDATGWRDYVPANYGPMVAVYHHVGDTPDHVVALDAALDELAAAHNRGDRTTGLVKDWDYLMLPARRT